MVSGFYNQQPARRSLTPTSAALQVSLGKLLNPWKVKSHVGSMDTKSQEACRGAELEFALPSSHPAPGPLEHPLPHGLQAGARPQASCHAEGQQVPPSAATHDCGKNITLYVFWIFSSHKVVLCKPICSVLAGSGPGLPDTCQADQPAASAASQPSELLSLPCLPSSQARGSL